MAQPNRSSETQTPEATREQREAGVVDTSEKVKRFSPGEMVKSLLAKVRGEPDPDRGLEMIAQSGNEQQTKREAITGRFQEKRSSQLGRAMDRVDGALRNALGQEQYDKVKAFANFVPFVGGAGDVMHGERLIQDAFGGQGFTLAERGKLLVQAHLYKAWGGLQIGLDALTLGGSSAVEGVLKTSGKEILAKMGPKMVELSTRVGAQSGKAGEFMRRAGQYSTRLFEKHPELHTKMGAWIDKHALDPLRAQVKSSQQRTQPFRSMA